MFNGTDSFLFVPFVCACGLEDSMARFFVPEENLREKQIVVRGDDVNHIKNVLRMVEGDVVTISCGKGMDYVCTIAELGQDRIMLDIQEERAAISELPVAITLFQALPKKDKMELVIQKAIELGASRIVPMETKRCVVKLDDKKKEKKIIRWQAIAEAAAKQCGRGKIPEIYSVVSFEQALGMAQGLDTVIIPYELCDNMADSVQVMKQASEKRSIGIFIGPEGGFERSEVEQSIDCGAIPISLGKRILRTETAGLAALSVLMFLIEGKEATQIGE